MGFGFVLNGHRVVVDNLEPHTTVLQWLRGRGLTGSKEGCAEGECGACAVLLREDNGEFVAVNGCLLLLASVAGRELWSVEGLGTPEAPHAAQRFMAQDGGSQCGYCTPGFVVSMAAEHHRRGREGFDLESIAGNLCRCTGYRAIRDAALALGKPDPGDALEVAKQQPVARVDAIAHTHGTTRFYQPTTLQDALEIYNTHENAKLVAGGTDWVVDVNLRHARTETILALGNIPELHGVVWHADTLEIGAGVTLRHLESELAGRVPMLHGLWPQFASRLIRNRATLGGNLGTASPIGDASPALLALGASLRLVSLQSEHQHERVVPLENFFLGYRKTALQPKEIIRSVLLPLPLWNTARFFKIAKRRLDDISSVAVAIGMHLENDTVAKVRVGVGGMAATPVRARACEAALLGQAFNAETMARASEAIAQEFTPISDARASAAYRTRMVAGALQQFFLEYTQTQVQP